MIGATLLSTCGARSRLVIKPPDAINTNQATSAQEPCGLRLAGAFMGMARPGELEECDS